jgi:hypothetical protein
MFFVETSKTKMQDKGAAATLHYDLSKACDAIHSIAVVADALTYLDQYMQPPEYNAVSGAVFNLCSHIGHDLFRTLDAHNEAIRKDNGITPEDTREKMLSEIRGYYAPDTPDTAEQSKAPQPTTCSSRAYDCVHDISHQLGRIDEAHAVLYQALELAPFEGDNGRTAVKLISAAYGMQEQAIKEAVRLTTDMCGFGAGARATL